jgi:hypothetical protein
LMLVWRWSDKPLRIIIMLLPCQTYKAKLHQTSPTWVGVHSQPTTKPPWWFPPSTRKERIACHCHIQKNATNVKRNPQQMPRHMIACKQNGLPWACNYFSIAGKSFHKPNAYIPYALRRLLRLQIPTQTQKTTSYWSSPAIHTWSSQLQRTIPICLKRHRRWWIKQKRQKLHGNVWKC